MCDFHSHVWLSVENPDSSCRFYEDLTQKQSIDGASTSPFSFRLFESRRNNRLSSTFALKQTKVERVLTLNFAKILYRTVQCHRCRYQSGRESHQPELTTTAGPSNFGPSLLTELFVSASPPFRTYPGVFLAKILAIRFVSSPLSDCAWISTDSGS